MKLFMLQYVSYPSYMMRVHFIGVFKTKQEISKYISKQTPFNQALPVLEHNLNQGANQYHTRTSEFSWVHWRITEITVGEIYPLYSTN